MVDIQTSSDYYITDVEGGTLVRLTIVDNDVGTSALPRISLWPSPGMRVSHWPSVP